MPSERLRRAALIKSNLERINPLVGEIQEYLRELTWQDLPLEIEDFDNMTRYSLFLPDHIETNYSTLVGILENETDPNIKKIYHNTIFGDPQEKFNGLTLSVQALHLHNNRVHYPGPGLAVKYRNLGLGKKIYKRIIYDRGHITSYDTDTLGVSADNSIESDLIWHSLYTDDEIDCQTDGNKIIAIFAEYQPALQRTINQYFGIVQ